MWLGYQQCTRSGVSEWTPAGVLTIFENKSGAGVDFLRKGRSRSGAGVNFLIRGYFVY